MSSRLTLKWALGLTLCFFSLAGIAQAGPYSSIVVYGDSLSDNGNLFHFVGQPGPPYYMGRRSDGPVAVEKLAGILGAPLVDFAWLGATSGIGNILDGGTPTSLGIGPLPGMLTEFAMTQATLAPFLPGGLFVVWGGPDDFFSPSPLDTTPLDIINRAVSNELAIVNGLRLLGAQNILAPGMPDLGLTPFYRSQGPLAAAQASAASDAYNAALLSNLPSGVIFYDTAGLLRTMVANPGAFGFSNVTEPCFDGAASLCANPSQYLFFDSFHPTTAAYGFAAAGFASAVPEPSSIVLSSVGFALCAALWRSRKSCTKLR
jgi:phospholipase/lecithinase/hemolysin